MFDDYKSTGTHWISFYTNGNSVTYLNNFDVEVIPENRDLFAIKLSQQISSDTAL